MNLPIHLAIVKGVAPAIGDPNSAEQGVESINLLDPSGIALTVGGWQIKNASLKNSGLWADSPVYDGRVLLSNAKANVIETMQMQISNDDLEQRQALIKNLHRFKEAAENYWTGNYQNEPVYLALQAASARAEQFALIYTISIESQTDPYDTGDTWRFTLSIEREPAWRMVVPPGGNPKLYLFWKQGKIPGVHFTMSDLHMWEGVDHFHYEQIDNRYEWSGGGGNWDTAPLAKNYIDIDAADVPGDAPALVHYTIQGSDSDGYISKWFMARWTQEREFYSYTLPGNVLHYNVFSAAAAALESAAIETIDACGIYTLGQVVSRYIASYTAAATMANYVEILTFRSRENGLAAAPASPNMFVGTWAAFLRCQQTNGAQGDVAIRLKVYEGIGGGYPKVLQTLDPVSMPYVIVHAGCLEFSWLYLGQFTYPFVGTPESDLQGTGKRIDTSSNSIFRLVVEVKNSAGTQRTLEFVDLALMPVSEAFGVITFNSLAEYPYAVGGQSTVVYDNTGYSIHGRQENYVGTQPYDVQASPLIPLEYRGTSFTLKPGVDNRLYFLCQGWNPFDTEEVSPPAAFYKLRLNIVPRCYGIADVEPNE